MASEREIPDIIAATVLTGDNVFHLVRHRAMLLAKLAVLATISCPVADKQPGSGIHRSLAIRARCLKANLESIKQAVFPIRGHEETGPTEVDLPISVGGITPGMEAEADALFVTLSAADGRTTSSDFANVFVRPGDPGAALVNMGLVVDPLFFRDESTHPVTVHATLYLTMFGNPRSLRIPIRQEPVNVTAGLQCAEGVFIQFNCRSIFRWPGLRVYASTFSGSRESSVKSISYSPFPSELGFGSVEQHSFSVPYATSEVTITTKEPLSHFRADLTIPNVVLSWFTKEAKHNYDNGLTGTEQAGKDPFICVRISAHPWLRLFVRAVGPRPP